MRQINKILITVTISVVLSCVTIAGDMALVHGRVAESKTGFIERNKGKRDPDFLSSVCADLASDNPRAALLAVDKIGELGDKQMLLIALKYPSSPVKARAARSLRDAGDKLAIPELMIALERANVDYMRGGTETILLNRELKSELVATMAKLSGVAYEGSKEFAVNEVKAYMGKLEAAGFSRKVEGSDTDQK